jgi:hypothetical protein
VTGFMLSPGFTPELTDFFVIELPLAVGLGYLFGRRLGFEIAFAANTLILGLVKLVTDYSDLPDAVVALGAIAAGLAWLLLATQVLRGPRALRTLGWGLGAFCVLLGVLKLQDFYDPLDLLLGDALIIAGVALWLRRHAGVGPGHVPAASPREQVP